MKTTCKLLRIKQQGNSYRVSNQSHHHQFKRITVMTQYINKDAVIQAKKAAQNAFNSLPLEKRQKLANGYERLSEVELLLSKGDNLSMATIKKRKRELEQWLLEWYNENK